MSNPIHYRPDIDGLRAVAVLAVVAHHFWPALLTGGYVGVDVFFVISGFLITKIIAKEIGESRFSFADFYERRARRIFPALFAMLAAVLAVGWVLFLPSDYVAVFKAGLGTLLFTSNVVFWRQLEEGYFAVDAKENPLLHTWSLGVEEQFYIVFPLLLMALFRYWPTRAVAVLALGAVISLILAQGLLAAKPVAVFFLAPFRAWELLVGSLLALQAIKPPQSSWAREALSAAGLVGICLAAVVYTPETPFPGISAALPVLGTAAVIHAGMGGHAFATRLLSLKPIVYVGLISYSLYLWHWPVLVLGKYSTAFRAYEDNLPWLLLLSFVLAVASYRFVEKPFRRPRLNASRMLPYAGAALLGLLCVSLAGWVTGGYPGRVGTEAREYDAASNPAVPFRECDGSVSPCAAGGGDQQSTVLLWDDSHMLAWMPALDSVLRQRTTRGLLYFNSGCPPLLEVSLKKVPSCELRNKEILSFVKDRREIKVVVLAGYWSDYLKPELVAYSVEDETQGFSNSLNRTINELLRLGRSVVVFGPVPVYESRVPFQLALERQWGMAPYQIDLNEYQQTSQYFYRAAPRRPNVVVANPANWLCNPICAREVAGQPLYRDDHHLSVFGAKMFSPQIAALLDAALKEGNASLQSGHDVANSTNRQSSK